MLVRHRMNQHPVTISPSDTLQVPEQKCRLATFGGFPSKTPGSW